jgi:hypothetical protein
MNNSYVQPRTHHFYDETLSDIKNGIHDGAQYCRQNMPENGNSCMECGEFCSKISLATNVDYISCSRSMSGKKSLIQCVKLRDFHSYNRVSMEKIYDHRYYHSFRRPPNEICNSFRENFVNNNTGTLMASKKGKISSNINSFSGIKRNCGRILPVPSPSACPLSIKSPFHTPNTSENRKSSSVRDFKVTNSQARPLSTVLPTPRHNINRSLKTILPTDKSFYSSKLIPSPKIHPSGNPLLKTDVIHKQKCASYKERNS